MDFSIRPARLSDQLAIEEFTVDTFDWGDYVAGVFPDWIADPLGHVLVATDDADQAIAVGRGLMLSAEELWLQGARVREDWRRKGIASTVGESIISWSEEQGAKVARLAVEGWNIRAQRQVENIDFRIVSRWMIADRSVDSSGPMVPSNGGQRAKARRKLQQAPSAEAEPAWVSWRSGPLVGPARGLHMSRWRWSLLHLDDLQQAGKRGELWSSQAGWAHVRRQEDRLMTGWLECGPDDGSDMIRSLVDLALDAGAQNLQVTIPAVGWLEEVLLSLNFDQAPMLIYERAM